LKTLKSKLRATPVLLGLTLITLIIAVFSAFTDQGMAKEGLPVIQDDNQACLACHAQPGKTIALPSGELVYTTINPDTFHNSVHGQQGITCTQCHTDHSGYPHPPIQAQDQRDFTLQKNQACAQCHQDKFDAATNDTHKLAREAGNKQAAVCSDCHGSHDITPPNQPRSRIPQTCARCHSQIFNLYKQSVHGSDLIGAGNPDVPSCIDCHNVHNVQGPSTTQFHLFSPQICARCHADETLMAKYNINTHVFETYLADFHGTTITLFQDLTPGQESNKPVCVDCHGVHNIRKTDDPNSTVIKENLLATCQRCHPDADTNFPAAWLGHYRPDASRYPLVYYVNLFYRFFIPIVLGGMAILVVSDVGRRIVQRGKDNKHE
jgi:predicted CXXCH cytochrome family protein